VPHPLRARVLGAARSRRLSPGLLSSLGRASVRSLLPGLSGPPGRAVLGGFHRPHALIAWRAQHPRPRRRSPSPWGPAHAGCSHISDADCLIRLDTFRPAFRGKSGFGRRPWSGGQSTYNRPMTCRRCQDPSSTVSGRTPWRKHVPRGQSQERKPNDVHDHRDSEHDYSLERRASRTVRGEHHYAAGPKQQQYRIQHCPRPCRIPTDVRVAVEDQPDQHRRNRNKRPDNGGPKNPASPSRSFHGNTPPIEGQLPVSWSER
jgi:hypothetical protein